MNRALYHISLHIGLGRWTYQVGLTPLMWHLRYKCYDLVGNEGKMIFMFVGPITFSVTYEKQPPRPDSILHEIKPEPADELQLRGLRAQ